MFLFIHMWTRVYFDGLLHNNFHVGGPFSMEHSACLISRGTDSLFVLDYLFRGACIENGLETLELCLSGTESIFAYCQYSSVA